MHVIGIKKIKKTIFFLTLLAFCAACPAGTVKRGSIDKNSNAGIPHMDIYEGDFPFKKENFTAELTSEDTEADIRIYDEEDFQRLAYFMSVAWVLSGLPGKIHKCLSNFKIKIKNDLPGRNAEVFWNLNNVNDATESNFTIAIQTNFYEAIALRTFVHEFTHVAGACALDDGDRNHSNKLLWLRYDQPANVMALAIMLEASYLKSKKRSYYLTDGDVKHIIKSFT